MSFTEQDIQNMIEYDKAKKASAAGPFQEFGKLVSKELPSLMWMIAFIMIGIVVGGAATYYDADQVVQDANQQWEDKLIEAGHAYRIQDTQEFMLRYSWACVFESFREGEGYEWP